jgi:hypothetical protein
MSKKHISYINGFALVLSSDYVLQILFSIKELLIHLKDRNKDHPFSVLGDIEFGNSPLLIRNLFDNPSMVKIISSIIDGDTIEVLEKIFEKHPETTIVCSSKSTCTCNRFLVFISSLSQLLIDMRILVPSVRVIRPWSKPLFLTPRISQLHQVSVLPTFWIRV